MPGEIHEECGVAAVYLKNNSHKALFLLYSLLLHLQHRGQLSTGISTFSTKRKKPLRTFKDIGTVNEVFRTSSTQKSKDLFDTYAADRGIGHLRYATFGKNEKQYAQPFERYHGKLSKWFSFCFNGNIINYYDLRKELEKDYHFLLENDTEIIMHYISRELANKENLTFHELFKNLSKKLEGSYNLALMSAKGDLAVTRDPLGIRPMCYAIDNGDLFVASESNAIRAISKAKIHDLRPGELIQVKNNAISVKAYAKPSKKAHCMFEWVYFAHVSSALEGRSVYLTRTRLGEELAKLETQAINQDCIVVPVPDSAKAAADSYAFKLGIPLKEGLIRNRFVGRTFIESAGREQRIANKYTLVKEVLKGKRVFLVDDSIVRGATTKYLVKAIKEKAQAKEVHLRVSCPPIMGPCFYGIDMSTVTELLAPHFMKKCHDSTPKESAQKIARFLHADSIIYQTIPGLIRSIGLPKKDLCLACINRKYPTPLGSTLFAKALDDFQTGKQQSSRTYEKATQIG